jgi:ferredoxin/flavodoxin---NADP+ reductase
MLAMETEIRYGSFVIKNGAEMTLIPTGLFAERVTDVQHYTDRLFRFRITRPQSLRFRSGEFVMLGLPEDGKLLMRAYSIASPAWDESLEFFSIKVPDGPLTERLQKIKPGDTILMRPKTTGTLVNDALLPGKRLFMLSTGTGIAPFVSLIRDPETYEKFGELILTHTCRTKDELQYGFDSVLATREDPLVGDETALRLKHFASTTREDSAHNGRITTLIASGEFFAALNTSGFNPEHDRIMMCGSVGMIKDIREMLEPLGFKEGSNNEPGNFVVERAFVG